MDESHLDQKYFIDPYVYNCPFCNRRNVSYKISSLRMFDWTEKKKYFVFFVICSSCRKQSMHLSFNEIRTVRIGAMNTEGFRFHKDQKDIDKLFFYSVPTSFFVLDKKIPKILRELFTEAEGCLKSNFLTGASACVRKVIYELASREGATGENYEERINSLKKIKNDVEPTFFDTLLTIQVTSEKVHEQSYDGWESNHLRIILRAVKEILREIYIIPKLREEKRKEILKLKEKVVEKKRKSGESSSPPETQAD